MPCSYLVRGDGVEPSLSRCRDVLPLHYNHMCPVCPGVKRPVSALPHSCRMMLRPRFVVECAGAGRPLCPVPGAAGWNRTTSHTGRILSISPVAAFCRIWHRHASRIPVLFNCPRGGAEGVLVPPLEMMAGLEPATLDLVCLRSAN